MALNVDVGLMAGAALLGRLVHALRNQKRLGTPGASTQIQQQGPGGFDPLAGKPNENAYGESFNGRFRDECLNENLFETLDHARKLIEDWTPPRPKFADVMARIRERAPSL